MPVRRPGARLVREGETEWVRTCVRLRTLKKTNKSQHDEKCEPLAISRNVRKTRGLPFGRLVFVGACLVGAPRFSQSRPARNSHNPPRGKQRRRTRASHSYTYTDKHP